jgi:hypothetical protein
MNDQAQIAYQAAASLHNKVATFFGNAANTSLLHKPGAIPIQAQLQDPAKPNPSGIAVTFAGLSDVLDFASLLPKGGGLGVPGDLIGQVADLFRTMISARNPQEFVADVRQALSNLSAAHFGDLTMVPQLIQHQFSVALSVVSIVGKLPRPETLKAIDDAYIAYLFGTKGFQTIDGDSIAPPTHLSFFTAADFKTLEDSFSEKNASRYVRDLVRLPIEAAADSAYGLAAELLKAVTSNFPAAADQAAGKAKTIRWMKGFASMAEAGVTGAVEEACAGVGSFQSNPLIAAGAGTFAGTWARKITQQVFLKTLN